MRVRTDLNESPQQSPAPRPRTRARRAKRGPDRASLEGVRATPGRSGREGRSWKRTLQEIVWAHNDRHAHKPKAVSAKTQSERASALFRCFRDLHALGFKIRNPYRLGGRHVAALLADWTADRPRARRATLSAATVQTELSHLRTFAGWIGKPGLVRPAESYVSAPASVTRRYAATADRSWSARDGGSGRPGRGHRPGRCLGGRRAAPRARLRLAGEGGGDAPAPARRAIRDRRARDRGHARRVARGCARHQGRTAAPRPHRFARQARGARRRAKPSSPRTRNRSPTRRERSSRTSTGSTTC